jgi:hypothetical protein
MVNFRSYRRTGVLWIGLLQGRRLASEGLFPGAVKHDYGQNWG